MKLSAQTVLVTGADGFIGSHLVEQLVREGARVVAHPVSPIKMPPAEHPATNARRLGIVGALDALTA